MKQHAASGNRGPTALPARAGRGGGGPRPGDGRRIASPTGRVAKYAALALVTAAILFVALVRVRLAEVPLERDEGEYAYAGQLILNGIPPYQQAYNMKFPGAYYAYALVMAVFGQTARGIRLGLMLVNVTTALLVFAIGRRLYGRIVGAVAAVTFALLSVDRWIMGVFAHATHFVLLPAMAALFLLLRVPTARRALTLLVGGALLGLAVLVNQHGFPFLPLGAFVVCEVNLAAGRGARRILLELGLLAGGAILPFAILCAVLQYQGVLSSFWFWTFQYAREYVSEVPLSALLPNLVHGMERVSRATAPLWIVGGVGFIALWIGRWGRTEKLFLTALLAASFAAICPGLYFREHYFILLLPAVAFLNGVAFVSAARLVERAVPGPFARTLAVTAFLGLTLFLVARQRDFFFKMSPQELSRARYGRNPFIESVAIANYIRERTTPEDRIAVLGSEPQIYFYSGRRSATGYIYMYPLMERQRYAARMREEMIHEIETAHPTYLVLVQIATSWLPQTTSTKRIVEWANLYTSRCYDLVGITDIVSLHETRYVWDRQVTGYQPESNNLIFVFRRKSDAPCLPSP